MINFLWVRLIKFLLRLRYRIKITGLDTIARKGNRGILFLPNHPALIDPIILLSYLHKAFKARALADRDQINRFVIRHLARRFGIIPLPSLAHISSATAAEVRKVLAHCVEVLRKEENLVLYPAGRAYRKYMEKIGGNSAVERILRELPQVRIVLVRIRGLWGSSFSWASGEQPNISKAVCNGFKSLLANGIFFGPKREVSIEFYEPDDLPRKSSRKIINRYLEKFYNVDALPNTYVPYTNWAPGRQRTLPEPNSRHSEAASGSSDSHTVRKPLPQWFRFPGDPNRPANLAEMTINEAFLYQARRGPDDIIITDQISGMKTYRDIILGILLLRKIIKKFPGDYVGIMMPASVAVNILYLAVLFSGKIPVMINWTLGRKNLRYSVTSLDVSRILTSKSLLEKLNEQGFDLHDIQDRFVYLEDIRSQLSGRAKILAWLGSRISWRQLDKVKAPETAVVLFTSGSESHPKAVPLTHQNITSNLYDVFDCLTFCSSDCLLGFLPTFHSFGLTITSLLPLCVRVRTVYYPNPTHGSTLGQIIESYKVTILVTAPTFLDSILRHAHSRQLNSVHLVVTGAEKCPMRAYEALASHSPQALLLEGYGVTECSPVISVNDKNDPYPGTIGKILNSMEYVLWDPQTAQRALKGDKGLLLVRGPNVFQGYLNHNGKSPFVELEGQKWYNTGDMVRENSRGGLTFVGRANRFVKRGGEMISLPAIESVLEAHYAKKHEDGPLLAVAATESEHRPELVLFTVMDMDTTAVNRVIRDNGLSGLHNIRRVIRLKQLPILGSGKTDYRALDAKLKRQCAQN